MNLGNLMNIRNLLMHNRKISGLSRLHLPSMLNQSSRIRSRIKLWRRKSSTGGSSPNKLSIPSTVARRSLNICFISCTQVSPLGESACCLESFRFGVSFLVFSACCLESVRFLVSFLVASAFSLKVVALLCLFLFSQPFSWRFFSRNFQIFFHTNYLRKKNI